jgi:hypothetical protein
VVFVVVCVFVTDPVLVVELVDDVLPVVVVV